MSILSLTIGMFLFGLVLTVAAVTLSRRTQRSYTPDGQGSKGLYEQLASSPRAWILGFFALVGITAGGAVAYLTDAAMLSSLPGGPVVWLGGVFGLIMVVYMFWGVYSSSRYRGLHKPAALAVVGWLAGSLVLGVISLKLLGFV
jgi:hypothetical protein